MFGLERNNRGQATFQPLRRTGRGKCVFTHIMCEHGAAEQTSGTLFRPIAAARCGARIAILSREGRMANMKAGLGICGVIVLTVLPVDGEGPLRVAVTPIHSFAPATVTIRARI